MYIAPVASERSHHCRRSTRVYSQHVRAVLDFGQPGDVAVIQSADHKRVNELLEGLTIKSITYLHTRRSQRSEEARSDELSDVLHAVSVHRVDQHANVAYDLIRTAW